MLDYLEFVLMQVELAEEGVAEEVRLSVVVVGVEPAHHCAVDELVAAALDGAGCRHRTVPMSWAGLRVSRVPCRHGGHPSNNLCVGPSVPLRRWD